jgi:hypothetical protein
MLSILGRLILIICTDTCTGTYTYTYSLEQILLEIMPSSMYQNAKTDGHLCYHHTGPSLTSIHQNVNCDHLGKHVIFYNERDQIPANNPPLALGIHRISFYSFHV